MGPHLPDVLLAPSLAMQELGSCGLSTTFFFDAQDRLVRRMWEADTCQLSRTVSRRFTLSPDHSQNRKLAYPSAKLTGILR